MCHVPITGLNYHLFPCFSQLLPVCVMALMSQTLSLISPDDVCCIWGLSLSSNLSKHSKTSHLIVCLVCLPLCVLSRLWHNRGLRSFLCVCVFVVWLMQTYGSSSSHLPILWCYWNEINSGEAIKLTLSLVVKIVRFVLSRKNEG